MVKELRSKRRRRRIPGKSSNLLFILYLLALWIFYTFTPTSHSTLILSTQKKLLYIHTAFHFRFCVLCVCMCVYLPLLFVKKIYIIVILSCLSSIPQTTLPPSTFQSPSVPFNFGFDFFLRVFHIFTSYFYYYYYYYYYYYCGVGWGDLRRKKGNIATQGTRGMMLNMNKSKTYSNSPLVLIHVIF